MKRRNLLTGIPLVATGFSGCLGGRAEKNENDSQRANNENDSEETDGQVDYEECTQRDVVKVENLPSAAEDEVRAAIEDGKYETDGELDLTKIGGILQLYLEDDVDGDTIYYETTVETEDGSTRLFVEKTWPKHDRGIGYQNMTEIDLTAEIWVEYEGEPFFEELIDMPAGDGTEEAEIKELEGDNDYRWGEYYVELGFEYNGEIYADDKTWRVDDRRDHPVIRIHSGTDEGDEIDYIHIASYVSDHPGECSWNEDGELNMSN